MVQKGDKVVASGELLHNPNSFLNKGEHLKVEIKG